MWTFLVSFNAQWPAGRNTVRISEKRCSLCSHTTSTIDDQRRDFLGKLVSMPTHRYARVAFGDLRITDTVRNYHLAKSILDTVGSI
jgi:hypothetical protein